MTSVEENNHEYVRIGAAKYNRSSTDPELYENDDDLNKFSQSPI